MNDNSILLVSCEFTVVLALVGSVGMYLILLVSDDILGLLESMLDKSVVYLVGWFHLYVGNEVGLAFLVTGFRDVGCKALHLLAPFTAVRCIGVVWVLHAVQGNELLVAHGDPCTVRQSVSGSISRTGSHVPRLFSRNHKSAHADGSRRK